MYYSLSFKTDYHFPQVERRFLPGFLNDPRNENNWLMEYENNLEADFPDWKPSKSYYYSYNAKAKKVWRSLLYSGMRDRFVLELPLLEKMQDKLSLSPFIAIDNFVEFRKDKFDVLNVFFNIDFMKSVEISSCVFEYGNKYEKMELYGLTEDEFINLFNLNDSKVIAKPFTEGRYFIAKKIVLRSKFDIFMLLPFSGLLLLSQKALNFFESEGIIHLDPWPLKFFELEQKNM